MTDATAPEPPPETPPEPPKKVTVTYTNGTTKTWTNITSWEASDTEYNFNAENDQGETVQVKIVIANTTNIEIVW